MKGIKQEDVVRMILTKYIAITIDNAEDRCKLNGMQVRNA